MRQSTLIISLFNQGATFPAISEQTGAGKKLISRVLAQAGINTRGRTFALLHDPSGIFSENSVFDQGNVTGTLWLNSWVPGMVFVERKTGKRYTVEAWVHESAKMERTERQMLVGEEGTLKPMNIRRLIWTDVQSVRRQD